MCVVGPVLNTSSGEYVVCYSKQMMVMTAGYTMLCLMSSFYVVYPGSQIAVISSVVVFVSFLLVLASTTFILLCVVYQCHKHKTKPNKW